MNFLGSMQSLVVVVVHENVVIAVVYPMISRRRFQQLEVLEGQNILVTISGKKNKIRVYYLSWLKTKILKTDVVSVCCLLPLLDARHVSVCYRQSVCKLGDSKY